ncbi:MAG: sensor histidine kinase [Chromatiales bacterium]|jgi:signal transduction histidine kinase
MALFNKHSLEHRLQLLLGLLSISVLALLILLAAWIGREVMLQFVQTRLQHDAEAIVASIDLQQYSLSRSLPPVYQQPLSGHYYVIRFIQPPADIELRSRSLWDFNLPAIDAAAGASTRLIIDGPRQQQLLVLHNVYRKQQQRFTISIAEDVAPLLSAGSRFLWIGLGIAAIAVMLMLLLQRQLLRRSFTELDRIRQQVQQVMHGERQQLDTDAPQEIRPLLREFNQLLSDWQQHLQRSRDATGNLAHALKTPLSLIRQLAGKNQQAEILQQAEQMQQLVSRELNRARIAASVSAGQRFAPQQDVDDLVDAIRMLHRKRTLDIGSNIDCPAHLPFEQQDMLELLGNLLDNAAKWARQRIQLNLQVRNNQLHIRLEDDGPGIPEDKIEQLLGRGQRLDESVSGHGLGLAIVNDIVSLYHGDIRLDQSSELAGLRVSIELPLPGDDSQAD